VQPPIAGGLTHELGCMTAFKAVPKAHRKKKNRMSEARSLQTAHCLLIPTANMD
jgi:hypothetical protein